MFEKRVTIDCRGHLLGRLASVIAKELLNGQRIVAVRCEEANIAGSFYRNKLRYLAFLNKRCNINPRRGPFHLRAPSRILWRTIRGMLPHKTARGAAALKRLKVFEGVPPPYDKLKRVVVPEALRVLRLKPHRKFTVLGRLSQEMGWKHRAAVATLEAKRKVRTAAWYKQRKNVIRLRNKALVAAAPRLAERGIAAAFAAAGH